MKRIVLFTLLLLIFAHPVTAEEYKSPFGFTVDLPSHWLVLSKQELKDNPDFLEFSTDRFPDVNKELLGKIRDIVKSGRVEYYINQKEMTADFADNISIYKHIGRIPTNDKELDELRQVFPAQALQAYGRKVNLYACELSRLDRSNALYMDFDGMVEGTRSLQYQIQKSPSVTLLITATCKNSTLDTMKKEFEDILNSFKMN